MDKNVQTALEKNKEVIKKVLDIYKEDSELSVSSTGFTIDSSSYIDQLNEETQQNERVFEGYKVKNSILIKSSNSQKAGKVIDDAINNEFNSVDFVKFSPDDKQIELARQKLLSEAVKDARKKIDLLLENLKQEVIGVKRVDNIHENISKPNDNVNSIAFALGGNDSNKTQLNESQKTMTINVRVQFITQQINQDLE
ncbi:outer membrane protein, putative [Ichthyophthirius multifiliis]|uniref:Outer membrane protein, putative n=1 Tax=Ichthyophthirius multifiliis TaxID=5932 RepID=G0QSN0_ICHMU|nr:outer membrane protein, putative [Ichthyophthirius multifiliis]EGR31775.1 outer membrane protein, putative [Ichthyophthirius multifiliis]|eukprot:XP_004035261.1 outer membrane protein, putative [Ichthyophthirius multifiliis]